MKGFTLIEAMITIVVFAILLTIAIPSMQNLINYWRLQTAKQRLMSAIHYARQTAINHNQLVTLCPSEDNKHCINDWNKKLIVFIGNSEQQKVLSVFNSIGYGRLTANLFKTNQFVRFNNDGFTDDQNGNFVFCYHDKSWKIILNRAGRIRVDENAAC